jgi:hypothetical protein
MTVTNFMATTTAKDAYKAKIKEYKHLSNISTHKQHDCSWLQKNCYKEGVAEGATILEQEQGCGEKKSFAIGDNDQPLVFRSTGNLMNQSPR